MRPAMGGPLQVVATLRPEFLDQILTDHGLGTLPTQAHVLRPLPRASLRSVIEGPARLAGIDVDAQLIERLITDTPSGEALPLLAFTLGELAADVARGGQLSGERYERLGGVQGALIAEAEAALAEAVRTGHRSREEVISGLLRLVTVDERGEPTRWRVHRQDLPDPVANDLDIFVAHRLLTTDTDSVGNVIVGVAHEAFLSAWPPLANSIDAAASALKARRAVELAAAEWIRSETPTRLLWGAGQLAAAVANTGARIDKHDRTPAATATKGIPQSKRVPGGWSSWRRRRLVTDRVELSAQAREFLIASIRHDSFRRRRTITILSVLLVLALGGFGIAVIQQRTAERQQEIATSRQLVAQADALRDTDPRTALQLGVAAYRINPGVETYSGLLGTLTATRLAGTLGGPSMRTSAVGFSADGRTLAVGESDGAASLWDLTGEIRTRLGGLSGVKDPSSVASLMFSPQGHTLAEIKSDGNVILWNVLDRTHPRLLRQFSTDSHAPVIRIAFFPDGHTFATISSHGTAILWSVSDSRLRKHLGQLLNSPDEQVISAAFTPDGHTVAILSSSDNTVLWHLDGKTRPRQIGRIPSSSHGIATSVAIASKSHTLAIGRADGTTALWDIADAAQPQQLGIPLTGHRSSVNWVAFSPDGLTLAAASSDGTVTLWDITKRTRPRQSGPPLAGHHALVIYAEFSPSGRTLATVGSDDTTILWDVTERYPAVGPPLDGVHGYMTSVTFDRNVLITLGSDGTQILWDTTERNRPRQLGPPRARNGTTSDSLATSPNGKTQVISTLDGAAILLDITDPARPRQLAELTDGSHGLVTSAAFAPDERTLATANSDGTTVLWDVFERTHPEQLGQLLASFHGRVNSVAFAPDSRTLATAWADGTVILWDISDRIRSRQLGQPLTAQRGSVNSVAFAPDGQTLATANSDGTAILWDVSIINQLRDHAIERACLIADGGLSRDAWVHYIQGIGYRSTCAS